MTPKEKAKELYDKYYDLLDNSMNIDWNQEAKQCASIAVEEILNLDLQVTTNGQKNTSVYKSRFIKIFFKEVKEEITNL